MELLTEAAYTKELEKEIVRLLQDLEELQGAYEELSHRVLSLQESMEKIFLEAQDVL